MYLIDTLVQFATFAATAEELPAPKGINLIEMAIPVFFILIGVELVIHIFMKTRGFYRLNDSVNDLSMGITDQVLGAFLKSIVSVGYLYIYEHWRLFEITGDSVSMWVACLLFYDMQYYWAHRMSHEVNVIWGSHIPHHSSEEYNLTVALRQGAFQGCFFWIFYLPLALVGFPIFMFIAMAQVDTLYQFWIHTRSVGKLGPLELVLNTPSHHRVHHGKNPKYIDKNHGGILIIWDRLFRSFQVEEEEPTYGTAKPLKSWNPIWGQIHYWIDLALLAWHAPRWRDKFLVWFMQPAWRPQGLEKKGTPAYQTKEFYEKYNPRIPVSLSIYAFCQFVPLLAFSTYFLSIEGTLEWPLKCAMAGYIMFGLVCCGAIFESKRWAMWAEVARQVFNGAIISYWAYNTLGLGSLWGKLAIAIGIVSACAYINWLLRYRKIFRQPVGPFLTFQMPHDTQEPQEEPVSAK
jgi:alkylglycerol monooxygenase